MEIPPEVLAAKNAVQFALLQIPGVVGVGIGYREDNGELVDELAIRIHIADDVAPAELPTNVGGVAVSLIPGTIVPLVMPDDTRYAELGGGLKITKPTRGFGTMGAIVKDVSTGELLGLTNFHVVGPNTDTFPDTVWQPTNPPLVIGVAVSADDNIGHVIRVDFPQTPPLPFATERVGLVDAAVFPLDVAQSHGRTLSAKILSDSGPPPNLIDRVTATDHAVLGQDVRKRGFRTRLTRGFVVGVFSTFQWTAGPSNTFVIDQAEIIGASANPGRIFAESGDSGALVLDSGTPTAVGLLWGAKRGGTHAVMSGARDV